MINYLKLLNLELRKMRLGEDGVELCYGEILKANKNKIFGGGVKLIHLNKEYPEDTNNFNVLYLVSSFLPIFAETWIKKAKKIGAKVVWNQNGVGYPGWAGEKYLEINQSMARLIHQADFVVFQSNFCKKSSDIYMGEFKGESEIVYNPVNTEQFSFVKRKRDNKVKLLVMGSHHFKERVTGPLEALKLLKEKGIEAELQIGGRMTWEGALEEVNQMINDFNLDKSVKILGSYTQDEAVKIYQDNDILLHFQYNDASPTVPLEAMSTGMPVVSTNSGGLAEIIDSKCGELIEVEKSYEKMVYPKSSEITTAIAKIIDNYDSYSKEAAKWTRGNFEVFSWLEKHKLIFENIIKNA